MLIYTTSNRLEDVLPVLVMVPLTSHQDRVVLVTGGEAVQCGQVGYPFGSEVPHVHPVLVGSLGKDEEEEKFPNFKFAGICLFFVWEVHSILDVLLVGCDV